MNIFGLGFLMNFIRGWRYRGKLSERMWRIPVRFLVLSWWAGLRGALAFALSVRDGVMPTYASVTLFLVFVTVLVCGGTIVPCLKMLRIRSNASNHGAGHGGSSSASKNENHGGDNDFGDEEMTTRLRQSRRGSSEGIDIAELACRGELQMPLTAGPFVEFDNRYLVPFFTPQRRRKILGMGAWSIAMAPFSARQSKIIREKAMRKESRLTSMMQSEGNAAEVFDDEVDTPTSVAASATMRIDSPLDTTLPEYIEGSYQSASTPPAVGGSSISITSPVELLRSSVFSTSGRSSAGLGSADSNEPRTGLL